MASLPLSSSISALVSSPVALTTNFSWLTSNLTLSLMDCASSIMSRRLAAVILTLALNGTFGVGTSSVEGWSVALVCVEGRFGPFEVDHGYVGWIHGAQFDPVRRGVEVGFFDQA